MSRYDLHAVPTLRIGFNDLLVLRSIVRGYLAYLHRMPLAQQEKQRQILLLEGVYQRLVRIPAGAIEVRLPLSKSEIGALNQAMLGFADFVRSKVPQSRERDETLQTLEALRRDLAAMQRASDL